MIETKGYRYVLQGYGNGTVVDEERGTYLILVCRGCWRHCILKEDPEHYVKHGFVCPYGRREPSGTVLKWED